MNKERIVITGANGFVGRNIGNLLTQRGFEVVGIVRRGKSKTITFGKAITSEDLLEDRLVPIVKDSDALLHFIGSGKQTIDCQYETVNVDLTRNAIALCKKASIKKIIYVSGLGVKKDTNLGYFISKYKAEQEIMKSGLDYTIFRASYIIGMDDPLSKILVKQIKKGTIAIPGSGNYHLQPIFVEDVANIIMKSITEKRFSKKILDLVGPEKVSYNQFVKDFLGRHRITKKNIDFERAYYDALHGKSHFGVDELSILVGNYIGDFKKLAKISGVKFTRYREVLKSRRFS